MFATKRLASSAFKLNTVRRGFAAAGTNFEKFNFEDPFKLEQLLTDEEQMI